MTYTYNDQAIFEAVAGSKAIIRRPIGMFDFRWKTYAAGVVDALNSKGSTSALELGEAIHKAMLDGVKESVAKEPRSMKLVDILARELKVWPDQYYQIYQDSGGNLHGTLSNGDLEDCDQEDLPGDPVTIAWDGNNAVVDRAEWQAAVDALKADRVEYSPAMHAQRVARVKRHKVGDCGKGKPGLEVIRKIELDDLIDLGWLEHPKFDASYSISCGWPRKVYGFDLPPKVWGLDIKSEQPDVADLMEKMIISSSGKTPKKEAKPVEWDGEGLPPAKTVCELSSASKFTEGTKLEEFPAGTRVLVGGKANFGGHDVAVVCVEGRHFCGTIIPSLLRPIRTAEQVAAEKRDKAVNEMVETLKRFNSIHEACGMLYDAGYLKP